jgi:hypothetical protein
MVRSVVAEIAAAAVVYSFGEKITHLGRVGYRWLAAGLIAGGLKPAPPVRLTGMGIRSILGWMETASENRRLQTWWLLPLLLACVLVGVVASRGLFLQPSGEGAGGALELGPVPRGPASEQTVALTIDFGNGAQCEYAALDWHDEMTVRQLMDAASQFRPGITFQQIGTGKSALLTHIDGVENEGGSGRNWQYWVNDERADRSFAICPLVAGDRVLWRFATAE